MKKILRLLPVMLLLAGLTACAGVFVPEADFPPYELEPISDYAYPYEFAYELCPDCGEHYVHEVLRQPTTPLNIHHVPREWPPAGDEAAAHAEAVAAYADGFENVHTYTYLQFETDWYNTLILWPDEPLRDFSFVSLGFDGEREPNVFYTRDALLTIDELPPGDAVVLNVAFAHYLIPRGGVIFTDARGAKHRMLIAESMRGGCFPAFLLIPHDAHHFAGWE